MSELKAMLGANRKVVEESWPLAKKQSEGYVKALELNGDKDILEMARQKLRVVIGNSVFVKADVRTGFVIGEWTIYPRLVYLPFSKETNKVYILQSDGGIDGLRKISYGKEVLFTIMDPKYHVVLIKALKKGKYTVK